MIFLKKEVHFDTDLSFLLELCLQMEYENQIKQANEVNERKMFYASWHEFTKLKDKKHDFKSDLDEFITENYDLSGTINLNKEIIHDFTKWWWKRLKKGCNSRILKSYSVDRTTGIWNKKSNEFIPCMVGEHWKAICKELRKEFEFEFIQNKKNHSTIDQWIKENIVLEGNCYGEDKYTLAIQTAHYGNDVIYAGMDQDEWSEYRKKYENH